MSDYWKICIQEAFSEIGIYATDTQTNQLVEWIEGAHENYGMMHGYDCIPNPLESENKKLKDAYLMEAAKRGCTYCGGHGGFNVPVGSAHCSWDKCHICNGEGKL